MWDLTTLGFQLGMALKSRIQLHTAADATGNTARWATLTLCVLSLTILLRTEVFNVLWPPALGGGDATAPSLSFKLTELP